MRKAAFQHSHKSCGCKLFSICNFLPLKNLHTGSKPSFESRYSITPLGRTVEQLCN